MASQPEVIVSAEHNVYANLAFEEMLFAEGSASAGTLFLYRNDPCVVIGRNQNPWIECNLESMKADGVLLARRVSGGGAVYHDLGNLNYSWIGPTAEYDRDAIYGTVLTALRSLGIPCERTPRNDLVVGGRKFSGSAFRHAHGATLHHGTLLIDSDIDRLTAYLDPRPHAITAKGTTSVRSVVCNLATIAAGVTVETVIDALAAGWSSPGARAAITAEARLPATGAGAVSRLDSWEWLYAKTPPFSARLRHSVTARTLTIEIVEGLVATVRLDDASADDRPDSTAPELPDDDLDGAALRGMRWGDPESEAILRAWRHA